MARSVTVSSKQRFHSQTSPCPACGGGQDLQGEERCYGFMWADGRGFFCTNVEGVMPFNDEADAWPHTLDEEMPVVSVNGVVRGDSIRFEPLTLASLAESKRLPEDAFTRLGCREHGRGVLIGGKRRGRDPKYTWLRGRSPASDPLFPMPGQALEAHTFITAGETDAITLRHCGRPAYGITSGEKRGRPSLTPGHYRDLARRGAEHVTIVGDGDEHGQAWLRQEATSARAAGLRVSIVDLSPLYDHFGDGVKDVNELWQSLDCDVDAFLEALDAHTHGFSEVRVYTLDDLRSIADEDAPYIVGGLLSPGEKMGLTGPPKNYKSWIALGLAHAVATGGTFLGRDEWSCSEPRPVVFVEEEGDLVKFAQRVRRAFRDVGDAPFHLIQKVGFSLLVRAQVDWLIEYVNGCDAALLILDPWQRMIVGVDEDKAKETGPAWDEVHRITLECPQCAVLILHHANKAGGLTLNAIRGSSRFAGEVDLSMIVQVQEPGVLHAALEGRDVPNHMAEAGHLEVVFDASDPFAMTVRGFRVNVRAQGRPSKDHAVRALFESNPGVEFSKTEVASHLGVAASTAGTHVDALVSQGVLVGSGRRFRLSGGEIT